MRAALGLERLKQVYGRLAGRYDLQHALLTARSDQRGRRILVENAVGKGDSVLDCGAGTGSTGLLAADEVGPTGSVTFFDLSDEMLSVAREKVATSRLGDRTRFRAGDLVHLPFDDDSFDVVLSTYSLCPVYDPARGALEMYRVTRPGGVVGVAHSVEPRRRWVRWLSDRVEDVAWRLPWLSMGCRAIRVLPALRDAGAEVVTERRIGVPLWPFLVFVVRKPGRDAGDPAGAIRLPRA